ncbi:MAG: YicC family protein [Spirochaetaceae bacterium]|nr:YicC family protein [Spirochaetaceae bacterium]
MNSMTGYAYEELNKDDLNLSVEIKSYNSKYLDLSVIIPSFLSRLEMPLREKVSKNICRGKVEVAVKLREKNMPVTVSADVEAAKEYYAEIEKVSQTLGYTEKIPLSLIVSQEGVLNAQKEFDVDSYWKLIEPVFDTAMDKFCSDRKREGENLRKDIEQKVEKLEKCAKVFADWQDKMEVIFRENIQKRFNEILGDAVDEQRVMQEIAALLVKYTINEEIVRLDSHLKALKAEIENNPAPGRKLDFICQEINREINTIGSKNQIVEVGQAVIEAKDALENIREQIRNIE